MKDPYDIESLIRFEGSITHNLDEIGKFILNYTGNIIVDCSVGYGLTYYQEIDKFIIKNETSTTDFIEGISDMWSIYVSNIGSYIDPTNKFINLNNTNGDYNLILSGLHEFGHAVDLNKFAGKTFKKNHPKIIYNQNSQLLRYNDLEEILNYEMIAWNYAFDRIKESTSSNYFLEIFHGEAVLSVKSYLLNLTSSIRLRHVSNNERIEPEEIKNRLTNFYNVWSDNSYDRLMNH